MLLFEERLMTWERTGTYQGKVKWRIKNCIVQLNIKLRYKEERQRKHSEVLMMAISRWMLLYSLFFSISLALYTDKQIFLSNQEKGLLTYRIHGNFCNSRNWKHLNSINRELVKGIIVQSNNRLWWNTEKLRYIWSVMEHLLI